MALTKVGKEGITGISNSSDANAITIDSSERVGIGAVSPERQLHVEGAGLIKNTSGEALFKLQAANNSNSILELADTDDGNVGRIQYEHDNNAMLLYTNDSEKIRVTAGGNLNVGKTANVIGTAGLALRGDVDVAQFTRSVAVPLELIRLSNDGALIIFYQDWTQ